MSYRGHVQVKQPEYGETCLSSWISTQVEEMLYQHEVTMFVSSGDVDLWEIEIDDSLKKFMDEFGKDPNGIMDGYLEDDLKNNEYGDSLLAVLNEGMEAARKNNYTQIIIEWY